MKPQITKGRVKAFRAASLGKMKLTDEEKARWTPMLHQTWQAIAPDAAHMVSEGRGRIAEIIELCLDANRMQSFSDITPEEEGVLCGLWIGRDPRTMEWLRNTLNY
jgi:hypothetical protein